MYQRVHFGRKIEEKVDYYLFCSQIPYRKGKFIPSLFFLNPIFVMSKYREFLTGFSYEQKVGGMNICDDIRKKTPLKSNSNITNQSQNVRFTHFLIFQSSMPYNYKTISYLAYFFSFKNVPKMN